MVQGMGAGGNVPPCRAWWILDPKNVMSPPGHCQKMVNCHRMRSQEGSGPTPHAERQKTSQTENKVGWPRAVPRRGKGRAEFKPCTHGGPLSSPIPNGTGPSWRELGFAGTKGGVRPGSGWATPAPATRSCWWSAPLKLRLCKVLKGWKVPIQPLHRHKSS